MHYRSGCARFGQKTVFQPLPTSRSRVATKPRKSYAGFRSTINKSVWLRLPESPNTRGVSESRRARQTRKFHDGIVKSNRRHARALRGGNVLHRGDRFTRFG